MPVLLTPEQALALDELIGQANTVGLDCTIRLADSGSQPRVRGLGSLQGAGEWEISFLSNPKLQHQLSGCKAAAVILTQPAYDALAETSPVMPYAVVICSQPYLLYALLAQWFDQHRIDRLPTGIHASAIIAEDAVIAEGVSIGPYCVIESGSSIGAGSRLGAGCVIGQNSSIGKDCTLHARVTLYHGVEVGDRTILHTGVVLGADGFGFAPDPRTTGAWVKIAQIGGVHIGSDVEIGANTTVDRGAIEPTWISDGVKLDNQIMIGHNVHVGEHTAMTACVGVSGSTRIGKRCIIGGAAMFAGHLVLGDDVQISGGTAVTSNIDTPGRYTGVYPFADHQGWQRNAAVITQLGQLRKRLRALESALKATEK